MAPQKKRTYSKYDKKSAARAQESPNKRVKGTEDDDELRLPGDPPRGRSQTSSKSMRDRPRYKGPISFGDDDSMDIDSVPNERKRLSVLDKFANGKGKSQPINRNQPNIYGSREDFQSTMNNPNRPKKTNAGSTSRYLPTPPSDVERQQLGSSNKFSVGMNGHGSSVTTKPSKSTPTPTKASRPFEDIVNYDEPKQLYVPRQYKADKSPAPRRDICGNRLTGKSEQAELWSTNQTHSSFLRLPSEVRTRIHDYIYREKTILIGYETFRKIVPRNKPDEMKRVFKYHCTVYNILRNPFTDFLPPGIEISTGFTLLSNICRQLYLETVTLPFTANFVAFESHNIMVNFILHEQRLSSQQRHTISRLILPDNVPGGNMLTYLPNIERAFLARSQLDKPRGWYDVIRKDGEKPQLMNPHGSRVKEL
ncbi:hypothetical protein CC86DRAFT_356348 [Ophiobolus disseminans]|uniref:DUF7730 domain-containing protein n=1 Tax=Ophiobolus disseminans TaxID=1469910 RepID=A0A6A6ZS12_9PLEO|nr:hypothetical protein CC86DRAFT_356348 [Ophiobolus disseminans]